ncbi:MAG: ABC transporter ATP-binding protein [Granulosicoccus sp.]
MPSSNLLSVSNLKSGYGGNPVLQGVDLTIGQGEIVAVIGRNGMGKTTLMRSLIGLVTITGGQLLFDGKDISRDSADLRAQSGIGYIPQGRDVFPTLSVTENLIVGEQARAVKASDADYKRIYGYFPILKERARQAAGTLSGGQQQQLAIARAMISKPRLMLFDEPSEGIQPSIIKEIAGHIRQLNSEEGVSVLLVEQNLDMIVSIAQRGYVMDKGQIVAVLGYDDIRDEGVVRGHLSL